MAESFALDSLVIPGTYVQVRADALIAGAAVSTGNIGIVGTASATPADTEILSGFDDAVNAFGAYDAFSSGKLNLTRGARARIPKRRRRHVREGPRGRSRTRPRSRPRSRS